MGIKFIGVKEAANVYTVGKDFCLEHAGKAVLRVTALGLYKAEINGKKVGDAYLTPGWTCYHKMLQVQEYDVTDLLQKGENNISFTVAEGWYKGRLVYADKMNIYGDKTAVWAQLIVDGKTVVVTDESFVAKESYIRYSSLYDGEVQDFTAPVKDLTVCEIPFDTSVFVPQICEPVRDIERIAVKEMLRTPKGELVCDFGQNIAGVAEVSTPEGFEGTITLQFAEILVDGNFYTDNLRTAKATDTFVVRGKKTLCPEFTCHGFRYVKITGGELSAECVTAIVRHTDMKRTGTVSTSDAMVNRLLENVVWGQRDNFVDIPTDCPQRDERLGWTGDLNAFCGTASYNYDVRLILKKWLADLRNEQAEDGKISHIAPDVIGYHDTASLWCDAIVMVPWKLYEMYGDVSFLSDNYEAMRKYIAARESNCENGLMAKGFEYGDWLALDKEQCLCESGNYFGGTDVYFISNAFYAHCLDIVAKSAAILGKTEEAEAVRRRYERLLQSIRGEYFTPAGRLAIGTVTAQALALCFGLAEEKHRERLAKELNENVLRHGCRMTTGFIGTAYLLFALSDGRYHETAGKLLLNREYPGWLHEVEMGATTIWEKWNSLLPGGTPNPEGMNSYNHYAYGSVMEWVYRRVAGIQYASPGFRRVKIMPNAIRTLDAVHAEFESVNGKIVAGYEKHGNSIRYFAEIPEGVDAEVCLPGEQAVPVGHGKFVCEREISPE